jgi:hypothetical protein
VNPALVMLWAKEISAAANGMAVQEEDSLVPLSWCSSHIVRKAGKSSERVGHARYSRLMATLDEFYLREGGSVSKEPIVRSDIQRIFHRHMLNACLPVIYGAEFETCAETILKDNGWDEVKQEVLVVTCRREGKTMAVSLLVAGLLICVPYIKIVVFAVGMRTALQLVSRVESLCESHAIGSGMIVRPHAKELLVMRNRQDRTDTRSLMALPCNSKVSTSLPLHTLTPVHLPCLCVWCLSAWVCVFAIRVIWHAFAFCVVVYAFVSLIFWCNVHHHHHHHHHRRQEGSTPM